MENNLPGYDVLSQMTDAELTNLFGVRDLFAYEVDFTGLAASGTATGSFTTQADSQFLWQYGTYFADIAHAAQTDSSRVIPDVTVSIQDQSSGRTLMSSQVPVPSLFGTGQLPFMLPSPRFFRSNSQIVCSVTNNSAASTYNLKLTFIGTKFFRFA